MYSEKCQAIMALEFSRIKDMCYLDHAGATLYAESQIKSSAQDLCGNIYGNPHSLSLCSRLCTDITDQIRFSVLQHFHTNPEEYSIIFTSGATASLKLVAEAFRFTVGKDDAASTGDFVYLQDNHTSVLGMREVAARNRANIRCLSHEEAFKLFATEATNHKGTESTLKRNSLFVYPAQCNFSGVKYPLEWIHKVQSGILEKNDYNRDGSKWFCLLDAAAFVSTNPLDLSKFKPDFVCLSFYKIFGYPTGLGALLVKNSCASALEKCYFGGGTVQISLSNQRFQVHREAISERFEDGTLPFLSIIALRHGFETLQRLAGSMSDIAQHTFTLARYLFHFLMSAHHSNGAPAAVLYCDTDFTSVQTQGNIVNFNMMRPNGEFVGFMEVLNMANLHGIQLRTGCFCNPGACQRHLRLSDEELKHHFQAGHVCGDERDLVNGQPTGSIRVSFGYMTTRKDVDKLIHMLTQCFVQGTVVYKLPKWWTPFQENYRAKFNIIASCDMKNDRTDTCTFTESCHIATNNGCDAQDDDTEEFEDCSTEACCLLMHMFVYPVKSCGAVSVQDWLIGPRGFLYDREWMIVTPAGVNLTQKQEVKLCLIRPGLDLTRGLLTLDFPGMPQIAVPLTAPNEHSQRMDISLCQSKVCGDRVRGWDCGADVAGWLSEALGWYGLRLIRQWSNDSRAIKSRNNKTLGEAKPVLSLSNQAQFLLLNKASIQWLANKVQDTDCNKEGLMRRFRSNLVVEGMSAFAENDWTRVQIGNAQFQCEGPCTRCQMVCIDQDTAERTREPLRTIGAEFHGKMRFGIYLSHKCSAGDPVRISVGDKVVTLT